MKAISEETEQFSILRRLVVPPGISGASACNAKPCIGVQNPAKQSIAMQNPAKQSKVQNKPVVVFHCLLETIHWHEKVLEKLLKWIGVLRHWGERRNLIMYLSLGHHICSILTPRLVVCVVYRIMQVLQFLHTVQICMNLVELWKLCVYNLVRIDKSMNTAAERTS